MTLFGVQRDQSATRLLRFPKKDAKSVHGVPIALGMLFPDERIRRHRKEGIEILGAKRAELEELSLEGRLEVEWHGLERRSLTEERPRKGVASCAFNPSCLPPEAA